MKTTQTIELNDDERATLEKALYLIDQISSVVDIRMEDVFEYFIGSDLTEDGHYIVKELHYIEEMR